MLSSEEMILVMKPVIENVMKYKNQMADCIDRHRKSTIVAIIIICVKSPMKKLLAETFRWCTFCKGT